MDFIVCCWGLEFVYDIWANLKQASPSPLRPGCSVESLGLTINQYNRIADPGFSYDAAGNLTAEPGKSYAFDAENRMKSALTVNYTYDGNGKRVQKSNGKLY